MKSKEQQILEMEQKIQYSKDLMLVNQFRITQLNREIRAIDNRIKEYQDRIVNLGRKKSEDLEL